MQGLKNAMSDLSLAYKSLEAKAKNAERENMSLVESLREARCENTKLSKLKQSLVSSLENANIPHKGMLYNFDTKVKFINKTSSFKTLSEVGKTPKEDHLS